MTREEKINTLKTVIEECEEYQWQSEEYQRQRKETLFEIIRDLEQEPILDKIRAEIMTLRNIRAEHFDIESDVFDDRVLLRSDVLDILDKYKSKSEGKK